MATFGAISTTADVPRTAATVSATAQGADITTTTLTGTAGVYLVTYYLETTTAAGGTGDMTVTFSWTDASTTARTHVSATVSLTSLASAPATGAFFVELASGNLTYATANSGSYSTAKYNLYVRVRD